MKNLNPRIAWTLFFVVVNLVCGIIIYTTGNLLGEASGLQLNNPSCVPWITILVIGSYLVLLLGVFPAFTKVKVKKRSWSDHNLDNTVGVLLLILQLGYIAFFLKTGTGVAGSNQHSHSIFSVFWVLISCDSLFFIYYGFYRSSRLFLPNLIVSVVSNLLRGWNGIFIIILFMESARLMRAGKLKPRHIIVSAILVIAGYPIIFAMKFQFRTHLAHGVTGSEAISFLLFFLSHLGISGYFTLVRSTVLDLFARLQLVSDAIVVHQSSYFLSREIARGTVNPFWREGLLGLVADRFTGVHLPDLGVALTYVLSPWHQNDWNANPSYVGWFFVSPLLTAVYLFYTLFIGATSIYLVKMMKPDQLAMDMLWFAWCIYLIPGWLASLVLFTFSLAIFWMLHLLASFLLRWKSLLVSSRAAESLSASSH